MALAGDMKLKTFIGIAVVVVFGLGALSAGAVVMLWPEPSEPSAEAPAPSPAPADARPSPTPSPAPAAPSPAPAAPTGKLTAAQSAAMGYAGKNIGTKKQKDVSKGKPYKINVYQDEGKSTANRLKIDLDRDDKWDEKWTFDGDSVQRKVSPSDDENYSEVYLWNGSDWAPE